MNRTALLLGLSIAACGLPADANPALRCDESGACPADMTCHAGFCLSVDGLTGEGDDASTPAPEPDAGMSMPMPPDPAPTPTPDAGTAGDGQDGDGEDEQTTCDCRLPEVCTDGMCCTLGEIVCDDECVDPRKDKHHCGACDNECDKGSCKLGICVRSP